MKNIQKLALVTLLAATTAQAGGIVRPYQSARTSGMGGTRITTGLYEENFYGNPARATANPNWRFTILDIGAEAWPTTVSNVLDTVQEEGDAMIGALGENAGDNNHARVQVNLFGIYIPKIANRFSLAFQPQISVQADVNARRSYQVDPQAVADVGAALTFASRFLENDALSVGVTSHFAYRLSSNKAITMVDLLRGASISPTESGGEGAHVDFDLGATYVLPFKPADDIELSVGASLNNILGGKYDMISLKLADLDAAPLAQPRSFGFGIAARKPELWKFTDAVLALEFQDIGNNTNGSFYRHVHLGFETKFSVLAPRVGINQGYLTGGLGVNLKVFNLDVAYYAEELGLNVGDYPDHRLALRISFQI